LWWSATHGIENFDEGLVDEEGFEEERDDRCSFTEDEEHGVEPREIPLEDSEKGNLGEICEYKEGGQDDDGQDETWDEPGA
jgi:hypothetical protein